MPRSKANQLEKLKAEKARIESETKAKLAEITEKEKELERAVKKQQRLADRNRKIEKGALDEALFAFVQMTRDEHVDFLAGLVEIPGVSEYITKLHLQTGGTQFGSPEQFMEYFKIKLAKEYADIKAAKKKKEEARKKAEAVMDEEQ